MQQNKSVCVGGQKHFFFQHTKPHTTLSSTSHLKEKNKQNAKWSD